MRSGPAAAAPAHGSHTAGIILVLLAALLWSLNGALVKLIYQDGIGPSGVTIAFYRSVFAGLFLLPLIRGKWHTLKPGPLAGSRLPLRGSAIWCVIFFALMTVCFVVANTMTEAANAIILQYTSTFWVFGLSPWLLREKPSRKAFGLLLLAMIGIVIIFAGNAAADLAGLVVALASGLFYALLTMMIRRLKDSDSAAVTVLNNLGSALLILPFVLLAGELVITSREFVLLIIMGVVQFGLPYYFFSLGLQRVAAYEAALITLAEPILVPLWTFLAVGEKVPVMTAIGGGVILMALLLFLKSSRVPVSPGVEVQPIDLRPEP